MFNKDSRYRNIEEVEYLLLKYKVKTLVELKEIIKKEVIEKEEEKALKLEKLKKIILEKYTGRVLDKQEQMELYNFFQREFVVFINISTCLKKMKIDYEYEKQVNEKDGWRGLLIKGDKKDE